MVSMVIDTYIGLRENLKGPLVTRAEDSLYEFVVVPFLCMKDLAHTAKMMDSAITTLPIDSKSGWNTGNVSNRILALTAIPTAPK